MFAGKDALLPWLLLSTFLWYTKGLHIALTSTTVGSLGSSFRGLGIIGDPAGATSSGRKVSLRPSVEGKERGLACEPGPSSSGGAGPIRGDLSNGVKAPIDPFPT